MLIFIPPALLLWIICGRINYLLTRDLPNLPYEGDESRVTFILLGPVGTLMYLAFIWFPTLCMTGRLWNQRRK
jgi:hypothetical protein